eukprot:3716123-Prymnesium_polylepis.3
MLNATTDNAIRWDGFGCNLTCSVKCTWLLVGCGGRCDVTSPGKRAPPNFRRPARGVRTPLPLLSPPLASRTRAQNWCGYPRHPAGTASPRRMTPDRILPRCCAAGSRSCTLCRLGLWAWRRAHA